MDSSPDGRIFLVLFPKDGYLFDVWTECATGWQCGRRFETAEGYRNNVEERMGEEQNYTKKVLEESHTIAMVGLSPSEDKPSNGVAKYLKKAGYRVIPVNPGYEEILGEKSYKSLSEIPDKVDVVDIFMRADKLLPIVEEAVKIKPKYIWLQLGILNEDAKVIAEKNGIGFVMDKCMKQEHAKHFRKD